MELSCKNEYILLTLIELAIAYKSHQPLQIREISARQQISGRYLEQLLANLKQQGIVISQRGCKGGYLLAKKPNEITVLEVFNSLGELESPISQHSHQFMTTERLVIAEVWKEMYQAASSVLGNYTLQDLADWRTQIQKPEDLMYYI